MSTSAAIWRPEHAGDPSSRLDLLRHYEPVLAFTEGEMFFPMSIEEYLQRSSLRQRLEDGAEELLAKPGELAAGRLAQFGAVGWNRSLYLRFVEHSLSGSQLRRWSAHRPVLKDRRHVGRAGLLERLGDALARIPGVTGGRADEGAVAAAQAQYADILAHAPHFTYYGRVSEQGAYTVLSYHYFYAMSDWRSSFYGAGDHAGDWCHVAVYLVHAGDGYLEPAWVASETGRDVEVRSWESEELTLADTHPVLYVAAGSHTAYFSPADYVARPELDALRPVANGVANVARSWRALLGSAGRERAARAPTVPFVDYARGDGARIGAGRSADWSPALLDESQTWVEDYRGAWGPDEGGAFAAARSSTGPRYDRDGAVRRSWSDPVGWARLDRQPLPAMVDLELARRIELLEQDANITASESDKLRAALPQMELEIEALELSPGATTVLWRRRQELTRVEDEIARYETRRASDLTSISACRNLQRLRESGDARPRPVATPAAMTVEAHGPDRSAELLAGLVALGAVLLALALLATGSPWYAIIVLLLAGAVLVDSVLRGTLVSFASNLAIVLAVATSLILVYEVFWPLAILAIVAVGIVLLANDLREIRVR